VETAVNAPAAIAGCGAVCGGRTGPRTAATRRRRECQRPAAPRIVIGKTSQTIVAGFVPDEIVEQLRAADAAHADSRAFLFAAAALKQAAKNAGRILDSVPAARRGFVLSTTKANIEALDKLVRATTGFRRGATADSARVSGRRPRGSV
jgi:hypothetical protein